MYMGHYAIALGSRRWMRALPLAWLLLASIEPDLHDVVGHLLPILDVGPDTHTIPGVIAAAIGASLVTVLLFRQATLALGAGLLVLSDVAADYLTSRLPLWRGGPVFGLHLYAHSWTGFGLEATVIALGLAMYGTSPDLHRPARGALFAMGSLMVAMQAVWNFGIGSH